MSAAHLLHGLAGILLGKRYLNRLSEEIKDYFGVNYVFFASSGRAALYLILQALKSLSPKQQVVIPAYTCFSVPSAIVKAGLKVSLCDINPETFDFDPSELEKTIGQDTLCVLPSHLFGLPSDMDQITRLCKDRDIFVVEDAAQAMGGKYNGKRLGTIGDVGFFSFARGKNITCGSGGIVVTDSAQIADAVERQYAELVHSSATETISEFLQIAAMSLFINPELYWLPAGLPFLKLGQTVFDKDFPVARLSGMKAGLLYRWQKDLEASNHTRAKTAAAYKKVLAETNDAKPSIPYLRLPVTFACRAERDEIYARSQRVGLGLSHMYPGSINQISQIRSQFRGIQFPVAEAVSQRLLTIPTHHLVAEGDRRAICNLLHNTRTVSREARYYH